MQYKALVSAVLFSAMTPAMAQNSGASAMPTDMVITGIPTALPTSLAPVLMTAVPQSFLQAMGDPSSRQSIFEAWQTSKPQWYQDLPSGAKSYISSVQANIATATDLPTEMPTGMSTMTSGESATESSTGSGTDSGASATGMSSASGATGSGNSTSASTGGAPAPTGPVAAGIAGAAGILGLAVVL